MAFNIQIPELSGDYEKDRIAILNYMKEANKKIRLLENELRKEVRINGKEGL